MSTSWCLGLCLGCLCENGYFHKATNAINTLSLWNLKVLTGFTAWLTSGSEKHSYRVLGCGTLKPQISDLFLLRNPNIVWLFLSLSALFDSRQKWVHRKGKWVTATSVLSHTGGVEVAFNLTECSRCLKVNRKYGRRVQRKYGQLKVCLSHFSVATRNVYLLYLLNLCIVLDLRSQWLFTAVVLIFHPSAALYPSQLSLCLKMEKPKSMCSIVESTVQC